MPQRINATDLSSLTACDRQVYLDHHGDPRRRVAPDAYSSWLRREGVRHEEKVVGLFDVKKPPYTYDNLEVGFEITLGLMEEGVRYIYQGVLMDGERVGIPDLLERVSGDSRLGDWHYRPLDIKSGSKAAEGHKLQVMFYCALLESIQGVRPEGALLLNLPVEERSEGNLYREEAVEFDEAAYTGRYDEALALIRGEEPKPFYSSICGSCAWREVCIPMVEETNDVSLIPGLRRDVWRTLHARGISTVEALAATSLDEIKDIRGLGDKTAPQVIRRARSLVSGRVLLQARPMIPPADSIIFDVESAPALGVFYLMGTLIGETYEADLAEQIQNEGHMWWNFLTRIGRTEGAVVHYGNYERQTVQSLAKRHGGQSEADALLARMVDLEKTIKDSMVLPLRSYSLKAVAPWMGFSWASDVEGGADSILEYIGWLDDNDRDHLNRVTDYNSEDCRATRHVLEWLHRLDVPGE